MSNLLKVRLSLKGRPIRTFTFEKESVGIGRDPDSDIFLDNTGVSREHARIDRTSEGYLLEDLCSANGTLLNDQPISRQQIGHDDVIQIGKFSLWVSLEDDRRDQDDLGRHVNPNAFEGTTALSTEQLTRIQAQAREVPRSEDATSGSTLVQGMTRAQCATLAAGTFLVGLIVGAAGARLLGG